MCQPSMSMMLQWPQLLIAVFATYWPAAQSSYEPGSPGAAWSEQVKHAVREELFQTFLRNKQDMFSTTRPSSPKMLRLGFHDCLKYTDGTGGCDGCLDWEGITDEISSRARTDASFRTAPPLRLSNSGLEGTVEYLEEVYTMPLVTGGSLQATGKSRADLWAFATIAAVEFGIEVNNDACEGRNNPMGMDKTVCLQNVGEPECQVIMSRPIIFQTGRRDCAASYKAAKQDLIPSPNLNGPQLTTFFKDNFGFNGRESVAIMGAHTLGNFHVAVSGFWYTFTTRQESAFNNQYYRNLVSKDDWFFEDEYCTKRGTAEGKRGEAKWMMKSQAAWTNLAPVQWIQHKFICPNCEWPRTNSWPSGWNHGSTPSVVDSCANDVENGHACRAGTERWRFVWGRDEAATNSDMGMFYHFDVDSDGFPFGCKELDETEWRYRTESGVGNTAYLKARRNFNLDHGCGHQLHAEPAGSMPLHQIVEEFADNQHVWIDVFVPTLEKMLSNGYSNLTPTTPIQDPEEIIPTFAPSLEPAPTQDPILFPTFAPTEEPSMAPTFVVEPTQPAPAPGSDGVSYEQYLSEGSRCSSRLRVASHWGNLGIRLTLEQCQHRCTESDTCNFISWKDHGNRQCTSFRSCDITNKVRGHLIFEKKNNRQPFTLRTTNENESINGSDPYLVSRAPAKLCHCLGLWMFALFMHHAF